MTQRLEPHNTLPPLTGPGSVIRRAARRLRRRTIERGGSPATLDWHLVPRRTVAQAVAAYAGRGAERRVVHEAAVANHPLPRNVEARDRLPDDAGWWGYSFRDVPQRPSGETAISTLPRCRIVQYRDPAQGDDYYPAILTADGHALDLRELRFRARHAAVMRGEGGQVDRDPRSMNVGFEDRGGQVQQLGAVTWVVERVYDNHSHWLTAHLPKLLLLRQRGELGRVVLPERRTAAMDDTLRLAGIDPAAFATFGDASVLEAESLTLLETDRFRPELLRLVPEAFGVNEAPPPTRRVYISRSRAGRRKLVNEEALWPLFEAAGFERVWMERLSLDDQVTLMKQTAVLAGPHGAGLTNMLFCPAGCRVLEIADLSFPNPNFYAIAAAMGHAYWVLDSESVGGGHPLEKDMHVEPAAVAAVLEQVVGDVEGGGPGRAGG